MLSKKEIMQIAPPEEIVEIPGGKVMMRGLSAKEYGDYEQTLFRQDSEGKLVPKPIDGMFRAGLVARCLTDADGATFTPEEVASLDAGLVDKLHDVANRLCGVSDQDKEKLAAVFEPAQQDGSSTA